MLDLRSEGEYKGLPVSQLFPVSPSGHPWFPGYDEANSCGFDLITFCKPIGEYLLHSHRELGYGKVCLFGKELKAAVLHRHTALQCQHLVFDSLEGP